jgi:hypothetical protein
VQSIPRLLIAASLIAVPARVGGADRVAWREAPEYVRLIAPANQRKAYSISVTDAPLADVLAQVAVDPAAVATPGAWQPRNESPQDAFGTAGGYNRWLVAGLYGSRQPRVARGARMDRGRIVEAWTLVSPYPSADLAALHPGTMRLILKIGPPGGGPP